MCGLVAALGQGVEFDIDLAITTLTHRGPDSGAVWKSPSGHAALGHRRLTIVDLSTDGDQPMATRDGRYRIVYNGEIYNAPALRQELEADGYRFASTCDTEVLLQGYVRWGSRVLERLTGMFAFVIWDDVAKKAFGARDRMGIKPLYMSDSGRGLLIGSEAGAIIAGRRRLPDLDTTALGYVLTVGYVPAPLSVWKGIVKLPPGHSFHWTIGAGTWIEKYWEPPRTLADKPGDVEEFTALFDEVVRDHLMSDVPIGLFLSGGLDSSALATALSGLGYSSDALTIGFRGSEHNETKAAAQTASHLGMPHRSIMLDTDGVEWLAQDALAAFDEPQGYSSILTLFQISQAAAHNYKVVLAGDGGDEIFGGYAWYNDLDPLKAPLAYAGLRQLLSPVSSLAAKGKATRAAMVAFERSGVLARHAARMFPRYLPEEVNVLLRTGWDRFSDKTWLAPFKRHFEPRLPLRRALQRVDLYTFCADHCLPKVDRASMSQSLEVRVPFLDHRLVEWALSQPVCEDESRVTKPFVRRYMRGRVPTSVFYRPKSGFSHKTLITLDPDRFLERVSTSRLVEEGWLGPSWRRYAALDIPQKRGRVYTLYALAVWYDAMRDKFYSWMNSSHQMAENDTGRPVQDNSDGRDWHDRRAAG